MNIEHPTSNVEWGKAGGVDKLVCPCVTTQVSNIIVEFTLNG